MFSFDFSGGGRRNGGFGVSGGEERERVLILNPPAFFGVLLRVPEALSRLRQYRELLRAERLPVPAWLSGSCDGPSSGAERACPPLPGEEGGDSVLSLIASLGLFDRWTAKQGWPQYLIGEDGPLLSVIAGEETFEEAVLQQKQKGAVQKTSRRGRSPASFSLYRISSYMSEISRVSYLTGLKRLKTAPCLEDILSFFPSSGSSSQRRLDDSGFDPLRPFLSQNPSPKNPLSSGALPPAGQNKNPAAPFFALEGDDSGGLGGGGGGACESGARPLISGDGGAANKGSGGEDSLSVHLLTPHKAGFRTYIESVLGRPVQNFLEEDGGLRKFWPLWQKAKMEESEAAARRRDAALSGGRARKLKAGQEK